MQEQIIQEHQTYCRNKWHKICENFNVRCLELNISEACNYKCPYCIFHRFNANNSFMDPQMAKRITEEFLEYLNGAKGTIYLGSGEPLLNWDAITAVAEAAYNYDNINVNLMTNCSLLTLDKIRFFKSFGINAGFSIDGAQGRQHNSRIPLDCSIDSFRVVESALNWSKQLDFPVYSLSATYSSPHFVEDALFIIELCQKYGIEEFDLDYDISSLTDNTIDLVAKQLIECYKIARSSGLRVFGYWLIPYDNLLNTSEPYSNYCNNAVGTNICISAKGNLKICGYDPKDYGHFNNFLSIYDNAEYTAKMHDYTIKREHCMNCDLFKICGGQCIFQSPSNETFQRNCVFLRRIMENLSITLS